MTVRADQQLSRLALVGLCVGSMVGAGIFTLPAAFGHATGGLGTLIAWAIAGTGMLMLALVFQTLSRRRPDLDAGIYAYAREGFGPYLGFLSAFGYWVACCLAALACLILVKATLGLYFPVFGDGTTPVAIALASAMVWGVHVLVLRGVRQAAALNTIATAAKMVPIGVFVVVVIAAFDPELFAANFWGGEDASLSAVARQVRDTMLVTVFVFVGIEGASVYSRYAKRREDVGVATVLGFVSVLCLLVLVTVFPFGILPREELAALANPSMAGVMEAVVGKWGRLFVSVGLLVAILGNYLSWSLLAAEALRSAADTGTMPSRLAQVNDNDSPAAALWLSNGVIQVFLLVSWYAEAAFQMALKMTGTMTLLPYLLVAAYGLQLTWTGRTYEVDAHGRRGDGLRAGIATFYVAVMLVVGGPKYALLSALLYAPGTLLYAAARREQQQRAFTTAERVILGVVLSAAILALLALATGRLQV